MKIKNIAIIAHVDHGKTTLVDKLLISSTTFRENQTLSERMMDSNDLERERGITILAKNTAVNYHDFRINILDTPGHADFSGEVERIMGMVDGVLLVVDAFEGTMPQTRFVLKKALEYNLKPIVVINKIDRDAARPIEVVDEVIDLFIELGATIEQLEFPIVYTSAYQNTSSLLPDPATQEYSMKNLLDVIIKEIPSPKVDVEGPLQFQPALLDYNEYVGRIGIGRITRGKINVNKRVSCIRIDGSIVQFRIQKLFGFLGLNKVEVEEAAAGDIVAIAGLEDIFVGETICEISQEEALPPIEVSEPTVQMTFGINTGPLAGREGKFVTSRKIEDRLNREIQKDVSLHVERIGTKEEWIVSGRGELHLGILIENMRREGFEFQVSRPRVIIKEIDGVLCEPYEFTRIDVPVDYLGAVMEMIGNRRGILTSMHTHEYQVQINYEVPSRGLIGFMTDFMTITKGYGIISHSYLEHRPLENAEIASRKAGVLVSINQGLSTGYASASLEERGELFIEPGTEVYEGMIVGVANREEDLAVNITKEKQQSNMRSATKDTTVVLKRPKKMSLENFLEFINDDEMVEITPLNIRLRKKILDTVERKKMDSQKKWSDVNK